MTSLKDRFIVPPFSILDTRQGYWQERKRLWLSLGIQSELGRGEDDKNGLLGISEQARRHYKPARCFGQDIMKGENPHFRRDADMRSNLQGVSPLPDYVTMGGGCGMANIAPGTSIFDPVLSELAYRWFCPQKGRILDPFAGGSVRGIVASYLGYEYTGVELRREQVEANEEQARGSNG